MFYCCSVLNFELGWLIYGNTFHYSQAGIACMRLSGGTRSLWILMQVILVYGYLIFLMYALIVTATVYILIVQCYHRRHIQPDHPVVQRVPYMNAIRNIRREKFEQA